jgi:hypothetical protein
MLWILLSNEPDRGLAGFAEGLVASGYPVVHDAGQAVLTAVAVVEEGPWHDSGKSGLVTMATLWWEIVTALHDRLPFRAMWPRALAFVAGLPVNDQVSDFVRDGFAQEILEILRQQFLVDAQTGFAVAVNPGLTSAPAAQGKVNRRIRQLKPVKIAGSLFCLAHGCFDLLPEFCALLFTGHVI